MRQFIANQRRRIEGVGVVRLQGESGWNVGILLVGDVGAVQARAHDGSNALEPGLKISVGGLAETRVIEQKSSEHRQVGQALGEHSAQRGVVEVQPGEVAEIAQFRRDLARELVSREVQPGEGGEIAQFRRDLARELISPEGE